jgi:tight adherence protein C
MTAMTVWLAALLMVGSALLTANGRAAIRRSRVAGMVGAAPESSASGAPLRHLDRLGRTSIAAPFRPGTRLLRRAKLAGLRWPVERLAFLRLVAMLGALSPALLVFAGVPEALPLTGSTVLVALLAPEFALARMARRRRSRLERQVPDLVELLLVTTEAGLSPPMAFRRSAAVLDHALGAEIRAAIREMDLGVPWRTALDRLADTTESSGLRALGTALTRSQRLGASTGPALRLMADDLRASRRAHTEEQARRAPVKMLFPLVFLILPAFLLLTVGPVLLATIRSLH